MYIKPSNKQSAQTELPPPQQAIHQTGRQNSLAPHYKHIHHHNEQSTAIAPHLPPMAFKMILCPYSHIYKQTGINNVSGWSYAQSTSNTGKRATYIHNLITT